MHAGLQSGNEIELDDSGHDVPWMQEARNISILIVFKIKLKTL